MYVTQWLLKHKWFILSGSLGIQIGKYFLSRNNLICFHPCLFGRKRLCYPSIGGGVFIRDSHGTDLVLCFEYYCVKDERRCVVILPLCTIARSL